MNEEVKEILDRLDAEEFELPVYSSPITWAEMFKIRDYITNLQEEKEDYKSRCENAIDKMSKLKPFIPNEIPSWLDELENILNGGDE